ncbi:hypothetical protein AAC387_Pa02g0190 [Persea americana]
MDYKRVKTAYVAVLMSVVLSNAFCLVAKFTLPASGTPISVKDVARFSKTELMTYKVTLTTGQVETEMSKLPQ